MFLKSKRVSDLTPVVPSVEHFFSGVVIHHGVVGVKVCERYVGNPLFRCLGVESKVDGGGLAVVGVDSVDHTTYHKCIAHRAHWFCSKAEKICTIASSVGGNHSLC